MSKQVFINNAKTSGIYAAALLAAACDVPLAQVQLWVKGV
jgi:hypothetical protein